jgi:hypothetical protein
MQAFKKFLSRIAPGQDAKSISPEHLEQWLTKISGQVVNGHRLKRTISRDGVVRFHLEKVDERN